MIFPNNLQNSAKLDIWQRSCAGRIWIWQLLHVNLLFIPQFFSQPFGRVATGSPSSRWLLMMLIFYCYRSHMIRYYTGTGRLGIQFNFWLFPCQTKFFQAHLNINSAREAQSPIGGFQSVRLIVGHFNTTRPLLLCDKTACCNFHALTTGLQFSDGLQILDSTKEYILICRRMSIIWVNINWPSAGRSFLF